MRAYRIVFAIALVSVATATVDCGSSSDRPSFCCVSEDGCSCGYSNACNPGAQRRSSCDDVRQGLDCQTGYSNSCSCQPSYLPNSAECSSALVGDGICCADEGFPDTGTCKCEATTTQCLGGTEVDSCSDFAMNPGGGSDGSDGSDGSSSSSACSDGAFNVNYCCVISGTSCESTDDLEQCCEEPTTCQSASVIACMADHDDADDVDSCVSALRACGAG